MVWEGNSTGFPELLFFSRFLSLGELSPNSLRPTEIIFLSTSGIVRSQTSDLLLIMWLGVLLESIIRDFPAPRFSVAPPAQSAPAFLSDLLTD